jgi:hypothetical protein
MAGPGGSGCPYNQITDGFGDFFQSGNIGHVSGSLSCDALQRPVSCAVFSTKHSYMEGSK